MQRVTPCLRERGAIEQRKTDGECRKIGNRHGRIMREGGYRDITGMLPKRGFIPSKGNDDKMKQQVWLSYDLGVTGDYEGMYQWLDRHGAKECGDAIAWFSYDPPTDDILYDIREDLRSNVRIEKKR